MSLATVAKVAGAIAKNKNSIGKIVTIGILLLATPVLFSAMLFMQIMSAFETEGVLKSSEYMSGEQTAIYQTLQREMEPYYTKLRDELAEQRLITREMYSWEMPVKENPDEDDEGETE